MTGLIESLPKLSEDRITNIIYTCMEHLNSLGTDFAITKDDFEFGGLFEATALQGQTGLGADNGKFTQVVTFNANMFREGLEDLYLNTIYHEFLHVIAHKYMIINHIIEIDQNGELKVNDEAFYKAEESDRGHGGIWLEYAIRLNKVLNLNIPITPYCSEKSVQQVLDASIDDYDTPPVEIVCQDCDLHRIFLTVRPEELPDGFGLMAMYYDTIHKNKNHFCKKCNGTLYIIIRDAKFKAFLDKMIEQYSLALMFYQFGTQFA